MPMISRSCCFASSASSAGSFFSAPLQLVEHVLLRAARGADEEDPAEPALVDGVAAHDRRVQALLGRTEPRLLARGQRSGRRRLADPRMRARRLVELGVGEPGSGGVDRRGERLDRVVGAAGDRLVDEPPHAEHGLEPLAGVRGSGIDHPANPRGAT